MIERKYFSCSLYPLDGTCFVNDLQFIFTMEIYFLLILDFYLGCCWFPRSVIGGAGVEASLVPGGAGKGEAGPPLRLLTGDHGTRLEIQRLETLS